jgi:hypothetical protein
MSNITLPVGPAGRVYKLLSIMSNKTIKEFDFAIYYSIMANGQEYPNRIVLQGSDKEKAEAKLKAQCTQPDCELIITQTIKI